MVGDEVDAFLVFDQYFGNEGDDARRLAHLFGNLFAGVLVLGAQFLLGVELVQVLETEDFDLHVLAADLFPVGDVLVEELLDLLGAQAVHVIGFVERQDVALLDDGLAEQPRGLAEEKADDEQDDDARDKAAQRKDLARDSVNPFFHNQDSFLCTYGKCGWNQA